MLSSEALHIAKKGAVEKEINYGKKLSEDLRPEGF